MHQAFKSRVGLFIVLMVSCAGMAHGYTRAYIINNTGHQVFGLHVKLTQAALAGSAGSGQLTALFANAKVSADGMTLDFTMPFDAAGIAADTTIWIGWTDANPNVTGQIASYYFDDAAGNMVGGLQFPTPGDTGALPSPPAGLVAPGSPPGDPNLSDPTVNTQTNTQTNTQDPGSTDPGGLPPGGGGTTPGVTNSTATPEPSTVVMLGGGILLLLAARRNPRG